jgi:hypothetical protein
MYMHKYVAPCTVYRYTHATRLRLGLGAFPNSALRIIVGAFHPSPLGGVLYGGGGLSEAV